MVTLWSRSLFDSNLIAKFHVVSVSKQSKSYRLKKKNCSFLSSFHYFLLSYLLTFFCYNSFFCLLFISAFLYLFSSFLPSFFPRFCHYFPSSFLSSNTNWRWTIRCILYYFAASFLLPPFFSYYHSSLYFLRLFLPSVLHSFIQLFLHFLLRSFISWASSFFLTYFPFPTFLTFLAFIVPIVLTTSCLSSFLCLYLLPSIINSILSWYLPIQIFVSLYFFQYS